MASERLTEEELKLARVMAGAGYEPSNRHALRLLATIDALAADLARAERERDTARIRIAELEAKLAERRVLDVDRMLADLHAAQARIAELEAALREFLRAWEADEHDAITPEVVNAVMRLRALAGDKEGT